jgi:RND family efflux transporter MFP subunit
MKKALLLLFALLCACERERYIEPGAIPVRTEVVRRRDFAPVTALVGVVRAAQTIPLTAVKSGRLAYPRRFAGGWQTGVRITRGELLGDIRNDQVLTAQAQADLQMQAADADFERAQRSFAQGVVSSAEYSAYKVRAQLAHEQFNAAKRDASQTHIFAPSSGTLIVTKPYAPGVAVDAGTVLAQIAAAGAPVIESSAPAAQRDLLRPGQTVRFTGPGKISGNGRITEVASVIDPSGTARIVASIEGNVVPPPGTGVDMQVELDQRRDVLTVPEDAIVAAGDGAAVFILSTSEGFSRARVKRARVELGGRAGGRVEVLSGIRDGDRVVTDGAEALADGSVVVEAEEPK